MARRKKAPKSIEKYIKAALRRIWGWDPERRKAKDRARVGKDTKGNHLFRCEKCSLEPLARDAVEIDHIVPVEDVGGFKGDWTGWIGRLFCPAESLQILCDACHHDKSNAENATRRELRKAPPANANGKATTK